jgi:outer membrane lipoprotein-sorting protein
VKIAKNGGGRASILLLLSLVSCSRPPVKNPADAKPLPAPSEALSMLDAANANRKSMRASGRVTYFGESGRVRLKVVQVVERPARFRFETISPLEQPIDVMTSDGSRLWLLSKGKLHEGPATPENIARLLPLPLRADEIVDILLGGVPTGRFTPSALEAASEPEGRWLLRLDGQGDERGELVIDPERKVVERATLLRKDGAVRAKMTYDEFEPVAGGGLFATEIKIELPEQSLEVSIKLKEVEVNVEVSPTLFVIEAPPGVPIEALPSPPVVTPSK